MQPVAHVRLLAIIRGGFQPKRNLQLPGASGCQAQSDNFEAIRGMPLIKIVAGM